MFGAIVVDDEPMIRNGISSFINNSDTGFEVIGIFKDGSEAIDFLKENDVSLVVSDIKMINVSGIELAKYVYENKPETKVVILSGYADFEYAQSAIKYNVTEYLTKPTNFEEFKKILLKIRSEFETTANDSLNSFFDNIKQLYAQIMSGNQEEATAKLNDLIKNYNHGDEQFGQYLTNIFEIISDHLFANLKIRISSDEYDYKRLSSLSSHEEIYGYALKLLENAVTLIPTKGVPAGDILTDKIIRFVEEHFSENISLQDAADVVFFNASYCSRFFKKQTGENFSDYLLKVRMQHAAKLLKENKKINDISTECGFRSSGYFTKLFKEYYKCTPSEYMRKL